ncbi:MAG: group II intron reverse transcriptase/maturase [Halofilum sp. (in: g-proteobacteria)]|nr:group II intron reverse transcriptase/maturase [Halofilum sp. (in: g-proteobacteria)]
MPDTVGLEQHEPTSLRGIAKRAYACKDHRFRDLYRELNVDLLTHCWRNLNKRSASGVDRVTAQAYEQDLDVNLQHLAERLKTKRYRTRLVRRCYIPTDDGGERPLGIPALEDKLVQSACASLLNAIYEQDFLPVSYGYRPGRGARDAVSDLGFNLQYGRFGHVVEADIKGFFEHIDHDWLLEMLAQRIDDQAFLHLIRKWLKAGILDTDGQVLHPESGTPQGGIISPVLANVYLHHALDLWFERVVKPRCAGQALLIRYADDYVCAFQYRDDAERFYRVLPKRLEKFHLSLAPDKTRILRFSRFHPGLPRRFAFLGFELYWARDRRGDLRVMKRTARGKLRNAKRRLKEWIKANRHLPGRAFVKALNRQLVGHYNYYGLRSNEKALHSFYQWAIGCAFKWLNRRGGKRRSFNWGQFNTALKKLDVAWPRTTEKQHGHVVFT